MAEEPNPSTKIAPVVGTDTLGRPFTPAERAAFSRTLRVAGYVTVFLIALRFAFKLTRSREGAKDLMGRANLRLVRQGWDPGKVTLAKCMCRFVWSERMHELRETATTRAAVDGFLRELQVSEGLRAPSIEEQAVRLGQERRDEALAKARIAELRAAFLAAEDEVNLIWLELDQQGVHEPQAMADRSGRDVTEFYRAKDRRKRHVKRLLDSWSKQEATDGE